jgi:hypothetical protein
MSDVFQSMTQALSGYVRYANPGSLPFWGGIFIPVVAIWILSVIALSARRESYVSEGKKGVLRRQFRVWDTIYMVGLVVMAILTATYTFLWMRSYYTNVPAHLPHLLSIALSGLLALSALWKLKNVTSRDDSLSYIKQPVTHNEEMFFLQLAKQRFSQLKFALLLPFIGLLPLAFKSSPPNLVSFVFDVSTSMESPGIGGEIPLETGKAALRRAVSDLSSNTDIVISIFERPEERGKPYRSSLREILSATQSSDLTGIHQFFKGAERSGAISYAQTLGYALTESPPMYETIWSNYLYQREMTAGKNYANKVAVYITNGFDQLDDQLTGFFCENPEYAAFYSQENPVHLVNLSEGIPTQLGDKVEECGYQVWDGFDSRQFNEVLNNILKKFKEDWAFIYWLVTLCFLIALAGLTVFPKRR